jgi:hypothetical protein
LLFFKHYHLLDQVDMKIIFYALIRMLVEHGKNEASEVYDDTKIQKYKIEGYQELTNKLVWHLYKINFMDVQELKSVKSESNEISTKKIWTTREQVRELPRTPLITNRLKTNHLRIKL